MFYVQLFYLILDPGRITCNVDPIPEKVCPVCPGTFYNSKYLIMATVFKNLSVISSILIINKFVL